MFELVSITRSFSKTLKSQWLIILKLKSIYLYTRNKIYLQKSVTIRNLYDQSEENPKRSRVMCRIKTLNLQIPPNSGFYCTNLVLCLRVPISANKRRLILNRLRRYFWLGAEFSWTSWTNRGYSVQTVKFNTNNSIELRLLFFPTFSDQD